jgi:hypothetical protein
VTSPLSTQLCSAATTYCSSSTSPPEKRSSAESPPTQPARGPPKQPATSSSAIQTGSSIPERSFAGGANRILDQIVKDYGVTDDPLVRQRLMKVLEMRRNSRWSGQRTAAAVKAGGEPGPEVSTLKLLGAEIARQTRDIGLQAMGPTGMLWGEQTPENGLFHAYSMFTPALSIAGGSDQVLRNIMGERVLGLPREPGEAEQRENPWSELPHN